MAAGVRGYGDDGGDDLRREIDRSVPQPSSVRGSRVEHTGECNQEGILRRSQPPATATVSTNPRNVKQLYRDPKVITSQREKDHTHVGLRSQI